MPTVRRPLQSVVTLVAVAAVLVLAWATRTTASAAAQVGVGASSTCPPPLTLRVAAGNDAARAGKTVHIRATLRNHAAALPDMSMKIALPAGMCPIKTWTAPALKPRRRATLEGTASGGVNVYWSTFGLKAGGGRRFYVKATVAANLTGPAMLPVEALAWIASDGQCSVATQPLGVSHVFWVVLHSLSLLCPAQRTIIARLTQPSVDVTCPSPHRCASAAPRASPARPPRASTASPSRRRPSPTRRSAWWASTSAASRVNLCSALGDAAAR